MQGFTGFDKDDIIGESEGGRSTPKGGDRMTVIEVCTLIALVIDAILLGMAIMARK